MKAIKSQHQVSQSLTEQKGHQLMKPAAVITGIGEAFKGIFGRITHMTK